jgi:predicted DNA-binding transcriptional regulator YafY
MLSTLVGNADQLSQESVVRTLISAAHKDQLQRFIDTTDLDRIAAHPKHGHSPRALLDLLRRIPEEGQTFEVKYDAATKSTLVRLLSPIRLDFTLESREPNANESESRFVVVAVNP